MKLLRKRNNMEHVHLGDSAYASYDGYYVNLAVNHHLNHVISLEPSVICAFLSFVEKALQCKITVEKAAP